MAIQLRRGAYANYDATKLQPGEVAVVQSGDPSTSDGKAIYIQTSTGTAGMKQLATTDQVSGLVDNTLSQTGKAADAKKTGDAITATNGNVADAFSTSKAYAVGDYCVYNGVLYRFTSAHAAGTWNASHVTAVTVGDEVAEVKSALSRVALTKLFTDTTYKSYKEDCFKFFSALYVPNTTYKNNLRLSVLRRNDSGTWQIRFYAYVGQTLTLIYDFTTTTSPEKAGKQFLLIYPASGIEGTPACAVIDWGELSANYSMTGKTGNEMILSDDVFDGTLTSIPLFLQYQDDLRFDENEEDINALEACKIKLDSELYNTAFSLFNNNNYNVYTQTFSKLFVCLYAPDDTYKGNLRFSVLRRNNSGTWQLQFHAYINGTATRVYNYTTSVNPEKNGMQFIEIPSDLAGVNNSLYGIVDWSKITDGYANTGRLEDYMILSNAVYDKNVINLLMEEDGGVKERLSTVESKILSSFSFITPSTFLVATGKSYKYYPRQMVRCAEMFDDAETVYSQTFNTAYTGSSYVGKELGIINPNGNGDQSVKFQISAVNGLGNLVDTAQKDVTVKTFTQPTNKAKNVLVIGDSYMDYPWITSQNSGVHEGKGVLSQIVELAEANDNTLSFVGTHLSYVTPDNTDIYTESYGGWSEDWFISSTQHPYEGLNIYSPFYIDGVTCNFSSYFSTNGTPDIILFFLGMNGGTGVGVNTMITAIKTAAPSAKIIVCTRPPYFRYLYNTNIYAGRKSVNTVIANQISLFDNKLSDNISLCPIHMIFHDELHFISTDVPYTMYSDTPAIKVCTNHHPNVDGAKTLANILYQYISYFMQD